MSEQVRYRVVVSGRVQGVWFRESCRREARARGVRGWVTNRSDGTVEAVLEGDEWAVAEVIAWCRVGPPAAMVSGVDVVAEPNENLAGFQVR